MNRKKFYEAGTKPIKNIANGFPASKKPQSLDRKLNSVSNGKSFAKSAKTSKASQECEEFNTQPKKAEKIPRKLENEGKSCAKRNESVEKRKMEQNTTASKRFKKEKHPAPESDSDAEDYIDKFFNDLTADEQDGSQPSSSSADTDEVSSEGNTTSNLSEDDDGNAMSLKELLHFYGNFEDKQSKSGKSKASTEKQSSKITKTEKGKNKSNSTGSNQWIEEDNDVGLVYKDSDDEQTSSSKALVPVGETLLDTSDDDDFVPDESGDEEEDLTSEDELVSFEVETNSETNEGSFSSEYSSCEDGNFSGESYSTEDYDSELDGSSLDEEEDESYWDDSYDSEDDGDYLPSDDEDDLFIGRGTARIYEIDDNNVSFNSDIESAQIVELPIDRKPSVTTSAAESQSDEEEREEDEHCPELVPIYDAQGRLIDNAESFEQARKSAAKGKVDSVPREMTADESSQNSDDVANSKSQSELNARLDESKISSYQFYDSIDTRMSLLILKSTLYFSGYLTVQPLIGALEIMGYRLKTGECRSTFAARGFHCLNLTPLPNSDGCRKKTMVDVLPRLEKHFLDADLKVLCETFDPSNSVLVLLQSDCNNRCVEVIDKYMPEEALFPKVEFLKRGVFFTSEYLLNAEFLTEQVEKSTTLFESDPEWEKIHLKQASRIVVIGGKGVGKSTLCQYLVNQAIGQYKKAVLIDLDIGQPIQHIPETISVTIVNQPLLGVACFNPIAPRKSWLFGSLDVVSSPIFYIQNVSKLIQYCRQHRDEFANIPWIVNTMGYATGFGDELMAAILRMIAPSDVVQLVSTKKNHSVPNFQNTFTSDVVNQYNFNILRSEVQEFCQEKVSFRHCPLNVNFSRKGFSLNAPKRRNLALLAHLTNILNDCSSEWFNEVRPFCAPLDQLQVLITREDQSLAEQQLPAVLNATLVYLCRKTDTGNLYECLGIGIVRGVDKSNNVFLLQSLSPEQLAEVTVLAICSSSLPNAIFLRQSSRLQGSIPYVYNVG